MDLRASPTNWNSIGYKVGRVDQAETALGAEMRLAADKGKGKKVSGKEIVKRFVIPDLLHSRPLTPSLESYTKYTRMGLLSTKNSSQMIRRVTASRFVREVGKMKRTHSGYAC